MTKKKSPNELKRKPSVVLKSSSLTTRRYRAKYPLKAKAHSIVARAIRDGVLTPKPCESCGREPVHAHHDDYTQPMEVRWLCHTCHYDVHRHERPKAGPKKPYRPKRKRVRMSQERVAILEAKRQAARDLVPKLMQLREEGLTYLEMAKLAGLSKSQVYKIVNDTSYD